MKIKQILHFKMFFTVKQNTTLFKYRFLFLLIQYSKFLDLYRIKCNMQFYIELSFFPIDKSLSLFAYLLYVIQSCDARLSFFVNQTDLY
jgi:hypothetical protein